VRAQPAAEPGELLVRLRAPADEAALRALEARTGGSVVRVIPALGVVQIALPAASVRAAAAAQGALAGDPAVASVEPNARGRGGFAPSDPGYATQWHHHNTGQTGGLPDADIDTDAAWDVTRGSDAIVVAILDTGIDFAHPEFAGRLLAGTDVVNGDADPSADHPHGIQVAGVFGADADNGIEVAGVDHAARILPVKVLDQNNTGRVADLAAGLVWAADAGAGVINLSLIDYPPVSPTLASALQYARAAGAVLVACAGNHGPDDADLSGPGAYPETISVGWTDHLDERASAGTSASATGAALDLVAPGSLLPTVSNPGGSFFSGCSAATPVVAGIVSLLLARDPTLGHDEIAQILFASAEDQVGPPLEDLPGRDDSFGHGRVNAAAALALVPEPAGAGAAAAAALALLARRRARHSARGSGSGSGPMPNAARTCRSQARTGCWSRASHSIV
jgi:thermitase